jgi:hypothetical protein
LKKGIQTAICCPCGNEKILALGLCSTCYTLKRQDAEYFGGLREQVLERDGYACRVCGDPDPGVHHREPGKSLLHLMIALCAGCHAKVHRTKVVLTEFPPLLLVLWREQHPQGLRMKNTCEDLAHVLVVPCGYFSSSAQAVP